MAEPGAVNAVVSSAVVADGGTDTMRILIIEDDDRIALPLAEGLRRYGFDVDRVSTGAAALAAAPVDMVLLDLGLPDVDGIDLCRHLRASSDVPIIMITARGEEADRVVGLELGADDYLAKPFSLRELVARIRAVTRRAVPATQLVTTPDTAQRLGPLVIDRRTRQVHLHGEPVELAPKQFDLLALLADDPGAVCSRQQILDTVWDPHFFGPTKTLDVHVAAVRRKLGDPAWIETLRGVGFRLTVPGPAAESA
ncbi:response regulator transcription factor [Lentzea sp. NPDC004782]|uniref:response regulator transcription factor n=1 Tax=Lentzea sp. NPDC004782 TaxID=3154458 RepID=UPI0033A74B9F